MKRSLCLLIGKDPKLDGSNYLCLYGPVEDDKYKSLDAFIMNRFLNSDQVREFYKYQIDTFFEKNCGFDRSKDAGDIVIVETGYNRPSIRVRVLYGNIKQQIQEILNCQPFMKYLVEQKSAWFTNYMQDVIFFQNGQEDYSKSERRELLLRWKEEALKQFESGTDRVRTMLKLYEQWVKDYNKTCNENASQKIKIYNFKIPKSQMAKATQQRLATRIPR